MKSLRSNKPSRLAPIFLGAFASLSVLLGKASAEPLFRDDFDADSSANWTVKVGYLTVNASTPDTAPNTNDFTIDWSFDYGATTYKKFQNDVDYTDLPIPPSPHSSGSAKGLKISVNKLDDLPQRLAVNLYPKNKSFSGNYALKFDMWMNYSGHAENGIGSTELSIFGINHTGNRMNWQTFTPAFESSATTGSDGLWFSMTGNGGATVDIHTVAGTANGPGRDLTGTESGIPDRNLNGSPDDDYSEPYWSVVAPGSLGEAPGLPGKRWLQVEVSQLANVVTWKIDGHVILTRTNTTDYKEGTIMLGHMDIFDSIADPKEDTYVIFDNVRVVPIRTVTVTTTDNSSPGNDGQTSFFEALSDVQENDIIKFNIPGAGPHYIQTPNDGYPLITVDGLKIDGYSQPGASANTQGIHRSNNASIQIVLDSRTGTKPSTTVDFPGFGTSESGILALHDAHQFDVSGLAFLSHMTPGSDEEPSIYSIALVSESTHAHIHGNWFGVDPKQTLTGGWTVAGGRSAVASFDDSDKSGETGSYYQGYSWGAVIGVDGDGTGDRAEHNVMVGNELAIHLQTPGVQVSGNWINILPDGAAFLSPLDPTFALDANNDPLTIEAVENGKGDGMLIGTDGNSISDAEEGNVFGPVRYDTFAEFWRPATNIVIAGNYFGVGLDGKPSYASKFVGVNGDGSPKTFEAALVTVRKFSDIRVGSNLDGEADTIEQNTLANFTVPLIDLHGSNFDDDGANAARVTLRGNNHIDALSFYPLSNNEIAKLTAFFSVPLAHPDVDYWPSISTNTTTTTLVGTVPEPNLGTVTYVTIDLYLANPAGATNANGNSLTAMTYLGSFLNDSVNDADPDPKAFSFDISALDIQTNELPMLAVTANYFIKEAGQEDNQPYTSFLSIRPASDLKITGQSLIGSTLTINWDGGTPPYQLQKRDAVNRGAWINVGEATSTSSATDTIGTGPAFYRIQAAR